MAEGISIFGIRHHGPGSAHSLCQALSDYRPEIVLVEGPPEADELLAWAAHPQMEPPVALMIYCPAAPNQAVYYPFASFSPEWQAIRFAQERDLPVRFIDLPQACQLALLSVPDEMDPSQAELVPRRETEAENSETTYPSPADLVLDPLAWIAQAAGYSDGERWWEHQIEQRTDSRALFAAILELMSVLRSELQPDRSTEIAVQGNAILSGNTVREAAREAAMRSSIRTAQAEGYHRIAVVCGAWHTPALARLEEYPKRQDEQRLKRLPRVRVNVAWVPWTNGRLARGSGYGAGVEAPGWYQHLWQAHRQGWTPQETANRWLSQAAELLRTADLAASTAQVIEAVRLAEGLAALRDQPLPGLDELNEAVQAVLLQGEAVPFRLLLEPLFLAEHLGQIPAEAPHLPIQADLSQAQKRLRLPPEATWRDLDLDLRRETDLERSYLLHRLRLLDIPWGQLQGTNGKRGTFHEQWRLQWLPELMIKVVEAGLWGQTIPEAAAAFACHQGGQSSNLAKVTQLIHASLVADLPVAVVTLVERLNHLAAQANDVGDLMDALPPLVQVLRYGNVRQTDTVSVAKVVTGMLTRICIGLPPACSSLNDEAAMRMTSRLGMVDQAVHLLQEAEYLQPWQRALSRLVDQDGLHGLMAGSLCRLLLAGKAITPDEIAQRMRLALSAATPASQAAAWLEGFLQGGEAFLLHDTALWEIVDNWACGLSPERFVYSLPILRRTFAIMPRPERRQLAERVKQGQGAPPPLLKAEFDLQRANSVLPVLAQILGMKYPQEVRQDVP